MKALKSVRFMPHICEESISTDLVRIFQFTGKSYYFNEIVQDPG